MPEYRKNPVTGRWVIISTERAQRPRQRALRDSSAHGASCPFCAGNEALTPPEVWAQRSDRNQADSPGWTVRVVPNKYPALLADQTWNPTNDGLYESINGLGVHEVIIESPQHIVEMGTLSEAQFANILGVYRARILQLRGDSRWRYILIYKNQGMLAGATLEHVHSQLIALPTVPREAFAEVSGAKQYYESMGHCIYCTMIERETRERKRIIADDEQIVVFCPFAPRFAYETWILPKDHRASFEHSSDREITALAHSLRETLIRISRALDNPAFNYVVHSNPLDDIDSRHYHWHIEILPQVNQAAGFEWGSGCFINPVAPEDAAGLLRQVAF